jgi:hypothetical protein
MTHICNGNAAKSFTHIRIIKNKKKDRPSAGSSHTRWGLGEDFSSLTSAIIAERLLKPRTSWHQWDDFTTVPGLSSIRIIKNATQK